MSGAAYRFRDVSMSKAEYYVCRRSVPCVGRISRSYCQAKVHRRRAPESSTARNKAPTRTSSTGRNTINRMIVRRAMEMESSLAMPPRLRTPSHAEFTPNRPHSSCAIAFLHSNARSRGSRRPVARKFLFFRAGPTKKLPELPESPGSEFGQLGRLGELFSRSGEQM